MDDDRFLNIRLDIEKDIDKIEKLKDEISDIREGISQHRLILKNPCCLYCRYAKKTMCGYFCVAGINPRLISNDDMEMGIVPDWCRMKNHSRRQKLLRDLSDYRKHNGDK